MNNNLFLIKLYKKEILELINPSEEICNAYIAKSKSNLSSAKILLANNKLEESTALTYYSMYNLLTALLYKTGIKCENHTGSIIILKEIFNINNSEITHAKEERIDKQYYTDFKIKTQDTEEAIDIAEEFNSKLHDFILRLSNKEVKTYREKLKQSSSPPHKTL